MNRPQIMATVWAASEKLHENHDCTVKAVAIVLDMDYSTVHRAFANAGRKPRKGVRRDITERATKALGYEFKEVSRTARTAITIERDRKLQSGRYVIGMTHHLAAMIDGKLMDWSQGRRKKINGVFQLNRIDTPPTPPTIPAYNWLDIPVQTALSF